jgi:hypothetical protein
MLVLAGLVWTPPRALAQEGGRWTGATSGILRFPNSNQSADDGNAFGEALGWVGYVLREDPDRMLAVYMHGFLSADSNAAPFNNVSKVGVGLRYRHRISKALTLTFTARHDWDERRPTGQRRQGLRFALDGFYYRYMPVQARRTWFGLPATAAVLKAYATLETPGSLAKGDGNVVLTFGGELADKVPLPDTKWRLAVFADMTGAWDRDGNSYNNKLIPALGLKFEHPLPKGSFYAGARVRADWRWVRGTLDVSPGLVIGWYSAF